MSIMSFKHIHDLKKLRQGYFKRPNSLSAIVEKVSAFTVVMHTPGLRFFKLIIRVH